MNAETRQAIDHLVSSSGAVLALSGSPDSAIDDVLSYLRRMNGGKFLLIDLELPDQIEDDDLLQLVRQILNRANIEPSGAPARREGQQKSRWLYDLSQWLIRNLMTLDHKVVLVLQGYPGFHYALSSGEFMAHLMRSLASGQQAVRLLVLNYPDALSPGERQGLIQLGLPPIERHDAAQSLREILAEHRIDLVASEFDAIVDYIFKLADAPRAGWLSRLRPALRDAAHVLVNEAEAGKSRSSAAP